MRDVCVIGAGIVGASTAFHLARFDDLRVTIVDSGYPGAATTAAGTGWITARDEEDPEYRHLGLLAMEEHHRLAGLFPASPWLTVGGTLWTEDATNDFEALIDGCERIDFPVEVLTAAEVNARLEPSVSFDRPDLRVAHFPSELTITGSLLTRALVEAAADKGAISHLGSRVVGLEQVPGGRHRVVFGDGTALDADLLVNCAGPGADVVAGFYDIAMPMRPQPGIGIDVRATGDPLRRSVFTKELVAKRETAGVVRLRSTLGWRTSAGVSGPDTGFTGGRERNEFVAHVVAQAEKLLPSAVPLRPIATWSGVRPIPADGFPRVGAVASVPGYFEAVTHNGGIFGPLLGRLLAAEIATGSQSPLLTSYRPARFLN
ncbi:NAD(P)/FAD-dependent oxidoreductase [Georgenia yuyongxinii]|uniref:FAD-binding oxidoreductase n=1 Tax=Georgenia yuyongxinii TaxID=2589797 RepID=A0A552WSL6_9MICO|nr:FAD-dependent oxidoreductase [Georgenia yuyongxinii]TRW45812.1 FAD-binding oxidoreductase [Georgenia yuyongxinii]